MGIDSFLGYVCITYYLFCFSSDSDKINLLVINLLIYDYRHSIITNIHYISLAQFQ